MSTFLNMILNLVMGLFSVMLKWRSPYSWKDEEIVHFQDLISHMPLSVDVRSDAQLLISFQFKLEGTETYTMCYGWGFHMYGEVFFKLF